MFWKLTSGRADSHTTGMDTHWTGKHHRDAHEEITANGHFHLGVHVCRT